MRNRFPDRDDSRKPYCVLGARNLTSLVWKRPSLDGLARYDFNIVRVSSRTGTASHMFQLGDLTMLLKLIALLAEVLHDDGCMSTEEKTRVQHIAMGIHRLLSEIRE